MHIQISPRGFSVVDVPAGAGPPMRRLIVADGEAPGTVQLLFTEEGWEKFVAFVNDPEGTSAAAKARARVILPGTPPHPAVPPRRG